MTSVCVHVDVWGVCGDVGEACTLFPSQRVILLMLFSL